MSSRRSSSLPTQREHVRMSCVLWGCASGRVERGADRCRQGRGRTRGQPGGRARHGARRVPQGGRPSCLAQMHLTISGPTHPCLGVQSASLQAFLLTCTHGAGGQPSERAPGRSKMAKSPRPAPKAACAHIRPELRLYRIWMNPFDVGMSGVRSARWRSRLATDY